MLLDYVVIVIGVMLFGLQHSGISSLPVKNRIIDRWGKTGYAHIFNMTSIIALAIAFLSMNFWDWLYFIFDPTALHPPFFISGVAFALSGVAISVAATKVISVSTVADMRTDRMPELITDGVYSRVRHPLYLATILLLIVLTLAYPFARVAVFSFSLVVYVVVGAYLEERKLVLHYGQSYLDYRRQAGFMLPKLRHDS